MPTTPTWLQQAVMDTLQHRCPPNFHINPQALRGIAKGLINNEGQCPCCHEEWDDSTPVADKLCPCSTFRQTGECHCNLYHKNNITNID